MSDTPEPVIVREGWFNAKYRCPDCDWATYIASSDRLTDRRLHEAYRQRYQEHRDEVHVEAVA